MIEMAGLIAWFIAAFVALKTRRTWLKRATALALIVSALTLLIVLASRQIDDIGVVIGIMFVPFVPAGCLVVWLYTRPGSTATPSQSDDSTGG
jgi:hypothetical protein